MAKENPALQGSYKVFVGGEYITVKIKFADYDTGEIQAFCSPGCQLPPGGLNSDTVLFAYAGYHRDGAPSTGTSFVFTRMSITEPPIPDYQDTWKLRADNFTYQKLYGERYHPDGHFMESIELTKIK